MKTYSVSKIKTFRGMEGSGFNCNLTADGKTVAFCIDDANGGPVNIHWNDSNLPKVKGQNRDYTGKIIERDMTPNEKDFNDYVLSLPKNTQYDMYVNTDIVVSDLVTAIEVEKKYKRICKTKTLVKVGEKYFTYNMPWKDNGYFIMCKLDKEYGLGNYEIINLKYA